MKERKTERNYICKKERKIIFERKKGRKKKERKKEKKKERKKEIQISFKIKKRKYEIKKKKRKKNLQENNKRGKNAKKKKYQSKKIKLWKWNYFLDYHCSSLKICCIYDRNIMYFFVKRNKNEYLQSSDNVISKWCSRQYVIPTRWSSVMILRIEQFSGLVHFLLVETAGTVECTGCIFTKGETTPPLTTSALDMTLNYIWWSVWFRYVWFNGTSNIIGYLIRNTFCTYQQFYFKLFSLVN